MQVPFLDQLFYLGPLVKPLGGADISWIVGFGAAALLYLAGAKRFAGVRPTWRWPARPARLRGFKCGGGVS
jgi:NCS1 family nucleobase:cation symporter-1